jgi:hypothetical protein
MELPNPNQNQPYSRVLKDQAGNETYGIRAEHTPDEEIVDLRTGQSNMRYWKPEMVLDPSGCEHEFKVIDIGSREVECAKCHWPVSFHASENFRETQGKAEIRILGTWYPLAS